MLFAAFPLALLPDFGGGEMILILLVVLMLFGGDKMPQLAKSLGKSIREFRKAASHVEQEIKRAIDEVPDTPSIQTVIKNAIEDNKKPKLPPAAPEAVSSPPDVAIPAAPVTTPAPLTAAAAETALTSPPPEVTAHLPPPPAIPPAGPA